MLILRGDFMKQNLSAADRVFTYLYPGLMDELLPKLEKELHPGTRLVSCDFPFSKKKAKEVIDLERPKLTGQKLYIYEF
jgi:hypothetical protein